MVKILIDRQYCKLSNLPDLSHAFLQIIVIVTLISSFQTP